MPVIIASVTFQYLSFNFFVNKNTSLSLLVHPYLIPAYVYTNNTDLSNSIAGLNRNLQPHSNHSFFSNMFGFFGSSDGISARFPGVAFASKIALNMYRIDVHCTMDVTRAPSEDFFSYGIHAADICSKLLGCLPTSISHGSCVIFNANGTLAEDIVGYGAELSPMEQYILGIGRYHTTAGDYGYWALNMFVGKKYILNGFFFVQI